MNWTKALIAGVVAGIVVWLTDFVSHGLILGKTYTEYPVFTQEQANPMLFLLISICLAFAAAVIYAKTKSSWGGGVKGGATFGFLMGLFVSVPNFYNPLIYEGYPYFLSWSWTAINAVGITIVGVIIAAIYK